MKLWVFAVGDNDFGSVSASVGVRAMIAVTEIKKGSSYGKTENGLKVQ